MCTRSGIYYSITYIVRYVRVACRMRVHVYACAETVERPLCFAPPPPQKCARARRKRVHDALTLTVCLFESRSPYVREHRDDVRFFVGRAHSVCVCVYHIICAGFVRKIEEWGFGSMVCRFYRGISSQHIFGIYTVANMRACGVPSSPTPRPRETYKNHRRRRRRFRFCTHHTHTHVATLIRALFSRRPSPGSFLYHHHCTRPARQPSGVFFCVWVNPNNRVA